MVKAGSFIVDVGITRVTVDGGQSKLLGDVDPAVADVAGFLTPVPGGVGPCTVASLLANTVQAASWATFV
jgi:methylenetetrahydrofolate dehydrogenase (NADP+)/methenyltetrahydrofolate cyclohydrolase